ncbi:2',5'-phosphodiesterase 12 [Callorhinchus milii]|uniref:2',5'-phosphodiesterase 12 n=1 Tax=Callorhinchus milii TaxID=7868 RepID=A0A4W3KEZ2_CALMI|nr:2',5'-phosphodiesterase 12 [Callorhinchus milii]|eukprot:gi/632984127/ref/XP_007908986.1/ PREDICTED: 2',5'-phosphodiesterase 12 [Callorhinchus milii]
MKPRGTGSHSTAPLSPTEPHFRKKPIGRSRFSEVLLNFELFTRTPFNAGFVRSGWMGKGTDFSFFHPPSDTNVLVSGSGSAACPTLPKPRGVMRRLALSLFQRRSVQRLLRALFSCSEAATGGAAAMQKAVVRCVSSESQLTISLWLGGGHKHMRREQSESLGAALARIGRNALKSRDKKGKKSQASDTGPPTAPLVALYVGEWVVPEHTSNAEAWQQGAVLQVGEARFQVERNPPALTTFQLPGCLMAGFPVCPKLEIEFGEMAESLLQWHRETAPGAWEEAGWGRIFNLTSEHIGQKLKLKCTPGNGSRYGAAKELESDSSVEAGPGPCTFDTRHLFTELPEEQPGLRVVSYNLLADAYAQTEFSRNTLYPYCAPHALLIDYRQSLIKKELSGYHADIVCLQEVDKSVFEDSLGPAMEAFGFRGVFRIKQKQHEGLATFYRTSRYQLLDQHDVIFSEALGSDSIHSDLLEKVSSNPILKEKVLHRSTVLQVCILQSVKNSKKLCVANTHLYWHPKGGHIRLIQIATAFRCLQQITTEMYPDAALIFCGDFNSIPTTGLYDFITKGNISADHSDWASNGEEEECRMSLSHSFKLKSACGEPVYTNYVRGFQGCLDYIFIDKNTFEVDQVIPFPSHEEVTCHLALPSVSHPSDHIALVCNLKWR